MWQVQERHKQGPAFQLIGADALCVNDIYNYEDEDLGGMKEITLGMWCAV